MIEPHLPPAHGTGRPRSWPMREIVNGIFHVSKGVEWPVSMWFQEGC